MVQGSRRAVFLDRDGTIIRDVGYLKDPCQVQLVPGAGEALIQLRERGFLLVVVSNQSGIGRGVVAREEAERVHQRVVSTLAEYGVQLDAVYYCPHAPEERCECRKPSPGLILRAAEELGVDLSSSFFIGDKLSDVEAGKRAGCRTVLLVPEGTINEFTLEPDAVVFDWAGAVRYILGCHGDLR